MWVGRALVLGAVLVLAACAEPPAPRFGAGDLPTDDEIRANMQQLTSIGARCESRPIKLHSGEAILELDLQLLNTSVFVVGQHDVTIANLWVECVGNQPGVVVLNSERVTIVNSVFFNCERAVVLRRAVDAKVDGSLFAGTRLRTAVYGDSWTGMLSNSTVNVTGHLDSKRWGVLFTSAGRPVRRASASS